MESKRHSYLEISKLKMKPFWKTFQLYSGNLIFHTSLKAKIHFRKFGNAKKCSKIIKWSLLVLVIYQIFSHLMKKLKSWKKFRLKPDQVDFQNTAIFPIGWFLPSKSFIWLSNSILKISKVGKKIDSNPLALYGYFIERVKANLHIILTFSPIGDALRNRLRSFPSFIACTTIDWFHPWPEDALEMVANTFLESCDLEDSEHSACVVMCKHFHETVRKLSLKFEAVLRLVFIRPHLTPFDLIKPQVYQFNLDIESLPIYLKLSDSKF